MSEQRWACGCAQDELSHFYCEPDALHPCFRVKQFVYEMTFEEQMTRFGDYIAPKVAVYDGPITEIRNEAGKVVALDVDAELFDKAVAEANGESNGVPEQGQEETLSQSPASESLRREDGAEGSEGSGAL